MLSLKQIQQDFSIIGPLKSGSFGSVYAAKDRNQRLFAIKVLEASKKPKKRAFLFFLAQKKPLKEGRILAKLQKIPGIPQLYFYGENPEISSDMIVTELLGEDLHTRFLKKRKSFSLEFIAEIGEKIIETLDKIHKKNVIHCDIKPENILCGLFKETQLYLIDFGLSKQQHLFRKKSKKLSKKFVGNLIFAAFDCHFFKNPQKKHDFEALAYVLLYFLKGSLPWEIIECEDLQEKIHKIGVRKQNFVRTELETVPVSLRKFFEYVTEIKDCEKIDAGYLKKLMASLKEEGRSASITSVSKKSCNLSTEEGFCFVFDFY